MPVPPPEAPREVVEPVVPVQAEPSLPRPEPERPRPSQSIRKPIEEEAASFPRPQPERSSPSQPIRKAIDEVYQVVESLKTALSDMEEVLELLELAEVQKEVDEREIAALQQALSRLRRGQESRHGSGGARPPRPAQEPPQ